MRFSLRDIHKQGKIIVVGVRMVVTLFCIKTKMRMSRKGDFRATASDPSSAAGAVLCAQATNRPSDSFSQRDRQGGLYEHLSL